MGRTYVPGLGEVSEDQLAERGDLAAFRQQADMLRQIRPARPPQKETDLGVMSVWDSRPIGGKDFILSAPFVVTGPDTYGTAGIPAVLDYRVPPGYVAVLRNFTFNIEGVFGGFGPSVRPKLSVVVDRRPSETQQRLALGSFQNLFPCYEVADEGQTIGVMFAYDDNEQSNNPQSAYGSFLIHGNVVPKRGADARTGLGSPQPATASGLRAAFASFFTRKPKG